MLSKEKTMEAIEIMYEMFPNAECELKHKNPFELLIAVILSAQATDVSVNKATLFIRSFSNTRSFSSCTGGGDYC